jgi:cell division protein ZapA
MFVKGYQQVNPTKFSTPLQEFVNLGRKNTIKDIVIRGIGMEQNKNRVPVLIYGEEYVVKGNASEEYITMIAEYVDKKMKQIGNRDPRLPVTKLAVLAALNITDELSKLQADYDSIVKMIQQEKDK